MDIGAGYEARQTGWRNLNKYPDEAPMQQLEESNDQRIQNYLDRLLSLKNHQEGAISLEDMQSVARELGMTDEEVAAATRAAGTYLQRGREHIRHQLWDEAVDDLTGAASLDPTKPDPLYWLASAYNGRWLATGNRNDLVAAEKNARA